MSGATSHSQPPPGSSEEQEEQGLDEKKAQEELEQTLQTEVPELQQGQFTAEILGGLFLFKLKGFQDVKTAFDTLKDPKLAESLFDFEHPENIQQARASVRIADRELRKKESVNKGQAETRFFFWKDNLNPQQFRRAVFTTAVARRAERVVNLEERKIRFRNAIKIYGITDENLFNASVQQWLKKNPGRTLDDAYASVGAQMASLDRKNAGVKKRGLEEEQKKARGQAIVNKKGEIERYKKVAAEFHDGTRETTLRNLSEGLEFGQKGISPKQLGRGFSEIPSELADEIMGYAPTPSKQPQPTKPQVAATPITQPPPPAVTVQQPIIPKISPQFTLPKLSLPKISLPSLNLSGLFKPFGSVLGNFGSAFRIGVKKIGSKILSKVGSKAIGAAIGQLLGSLLPGIGNAAAAILSALGLDEFIMKFALYGALFAVLSVVAIFLLIIIGSENLFSTNTADNPIVIPQTAESGTQIYSWSEFEEKFLTRAYSP